MHPFSIYELNKLYQSENKYLLRVSEDTLWEATIDQSEGNSRKFTRRTYEAPFQFAYALGAVETANFVGIIEENRISKNREEELLLSIKSPLKGVKTVNFKKSEAAVVFQHEFAITCASAEKPILGTFGAGSCLILALYDVSAKIAILAHIDHKTELNSLSDLFLKINPEKTDAHLFGGSVSSKMMCMNVWLLLKKTAINIVNADLIQTSFEGASLAIDARNGDIFSPVSPFEMDITLTRKGLSLFPDFEKENTPLIKSYDGTNLKNAEQRISLSTPEEKPKSETEAKNPLSSIFRQPACKEEENKEEKNDNKAMEALPHEDETDKTERPSKKTKQNLEVRVKRKCLDSANLYGRDEEMKFMVKKR